MAVPFALDVLGAATLRQSLFVYGDYVPDRDANTKAKRNLFHDRIELFEQLRLRAQALEGCQQVMRAPLNRKLAFILNEQVWPALAHMSDTDILTLPQKCEGLEVVGRGNGFWVFSI